MSSDSACGVLNLALSMRIWRNRAVIRRTLGLVPGVEDMTNWGGDYLNGQAVVGASCADNSTIDDLERLFFRVRSQAAGQRG